MKTFHTNYSGWRFTWRQVKVSLPFQFVIEPANLNVLIVSTASSTLGKLYWSHGKHLLEKFFKTHTYDCGFDEVTWKFRHFEAFWSDCIEAVGNVYLKKVPWQKNVSLDNVTWNFTTFTMASKFQFGFFSKILDAGIVIVLIVASKDLCTNVNGNCGPSTIAKKCKQLHVLHNCSHCLQKVWEIFWNNAQIYFF